MSGKKIWSGVLPLSLLAGLIGGLFLLGRIGANQEAIVEDAGTKTIGITIDGGGKRIIRIKYNVGGRSYLEGTGKPFNYIQPGEQFEMKFLPKDPESIIVYFDRPVISRELAYTETECTAISRTLSVINFEYVVGGQTIRRETLYRDQKLSSGSYKVVYRTDESTIGYLTLK